jgi:hypothetical protein
MTDGYLGEVELLDADGSVVATVMTALPDLDAPAWTAEQRGPALDPGSRFGSRSHLADDVLLVRLSSRGHPRCGQVARASVGLSQERYIELAGLEGFGPSNTRRLGTGSSDH